MQSEITRELNMADEIPFSFIREMGGMFRLGSGVLGKSAIGIGIFIAVGGIAIYKLHSDGAILAALFLLAAVFFLWFFPVLRFVEKHPDAGLLDGSEWTGYQRDQIAAKGQAPQPIGHQAMQIGSDSQSRTIEIGNGL